eukprot:COSAG02_NODE_446_length_22141_cov_17.963842_9_plen_63_part_00
MQNQAPRYFLFNICAVCTGKSYHFCACHVKSYKGLSVRVFWYYILRSELDTALEKRERVTVY